MKPIQDINPFLPDSQQIIPSSEGGNGKIYQPGEMPNIVWQHRTRVPDQFEQKLIAELENIFESGVDEFDSIVNALNQKRLFDRSDQPWTTKSFQDFLSIQGY